MSRTYKETIYLAANFNITVDKVPAEDIERIKSLLKSPDSTIEVKGVKTKLTQLVPVRNILVIQFEEESND